MSLSSFPSFPSSPNSPAEWCLSVVRTLREEKNQNEERSPERYTRIPGDDGNDENAERVGVAKSGANASSPRNTLREKNDESLLSLWPASLPGLGRRAIVAFTACADCETDPPPDQIVTVGRYRAAAPGPRHTFITYGSRPMCRRHAWWRAARPAALDDGAPA